MRDVRDYRAQVRSDRDTLGSSSPFNIAAESLTLANFTEAEVGTLYGQHTADTGQAFPSDALARAFWWTQGQPWLVNGGARIQREFALGRRRLDLCVELGVHRYPVERAVRPTGARREAVVGGEIGECGLPLHRASYVTEHRRLEVVVEHLRRHAPEILEGMQVAGLGTGDGTLPAAVPHTASRGCKGQRARESARG